MRGTAAYIANRFAYGVDTATVATWFGYGARDGVEATETQ
jgi:hypothetical protein